MPRKPTQRRERILDAAIRVIARRGTRGATHRAVADEAGVPLAATTYYFESRDELLAEAFRHLADREIDELDRGIDELPPRLSAELAAALFASLVAEDLDRRREQIRAEHEMHLEAGRTKALRPTHEAWVAAAMRFFTAALTRAGSPSPELDAAIVLSVISGVQQGELAAPTARLELLEPMMRRLLQALIR